MGEGQDTKRKKNKQLQLKIDGHSRKGAFTVAGGAGQIASCENQQQQLLGLPNLVKPNSENRRLHILSFEVNPDREGNSKKDTKSD
jgi:hypothetical protein